MQPKKFFVVAALALILSLWLTLWATSAQASKKIIVCPEGMTRISAKAGSTLYKVQPIQGSTIPNQLMYRFKDSEGICIKRVS